MSNLPRQIEDATLGGEIRKAKDLFEEYCVELEAKGENPEKDGEALRLMAGIQSLEALNALAEKSPETLATIAKELPDPAGPSLADRFG